MLESVPKIKLEREPQGRLRWLEAEEANRLLAACRQPKNPDLADLVAFSLHTRLRQSEALGLTNDRVDRSRGVIRIEKTKSKKRREVPLAGRRDPGQA
jgi:integrase